MGNDPVNLVDPFGKDTWEVDINGTEGKIVRAEQVLVDGGDLIIYWTITYTTTYWRKAADGVFEQVTEVSEVVRYSRNYGPTQKSPLFADVSAWDQVNQQLDEYAPNSEERFYQKSRAQIVNEAVKEAFGLGGTAAEAKKYKEKPNDKDPDFPKPSPETPNPPDDDTTLGG